MAIRSRTVGARLGGVRTTAIILGLLLLGMGSADAQHLRGFRGDWNGWGYQAMTLELGVWRATLQANENGNEFKIAADEWGVGEWSHGAAVPIGEVADVYAGVPNSSVAAVVGRRYTFAMDNVDYGEPGRMLVQETADEPVAIDFAFPEVNGLTTTVAIGTSAAPSDGEKVYVRHSLDGWATSLFSAATGSGTNWSATIIHDSGEAGQTNVFYALTTTVAAPSHDHADIQTLRWKNNGGVPYSYVVGESPAEPPVSGMYINEVLSSNSSNTVDEDGAHSDWIELYNGGTDPVELQGWGLSDSYASPFKWVFGDVDIQPGQFLLVWASSKNRPSVTNGNSIHTSFAISAGGEEVILTHPNGTRVDELAPTAMAADVSIGRQPDGTGPWKFFDLPTPGFSNGGGGIDPELPTPEFSVSSGIHASNVSLVLSTDVEDAEVRYTLDGSEPTLSSARYENPIELGSKTGTTNQLSMIPTNDDPEPGPPHYEGWQPPAGEVFKFHTVRARTFKAGAQPSPVVLHSYLVDPAGTNRYRLPIVSIATDAANFFDPDIGIYVAGNSNNFFQSGDEWERQGSIEFFEANGARAFGGTIGIRLHGNTTRTRPRKALRIYARSPASFDYPLFPDKTLATFDNFILRNGGNDWGQGVIRDLYLQSLAANAKVDRQYGRPALVFLNGEYWGIHDLRERFDEDYIQRNYGLGEPEFVQVAIDRTQEPVNIPTFDRGNAALSNDYENLWAFMNEQGVASASNYQAVADRLDVDSFIDFQQANVFFGNTDWPGNNVRAWRSVATNRAEGAPVGHDARWRYMLYDTDFGFGLNFYYVPGNADFAGHDTLAFAASANGQDFSNQADATMMLRRFLENDDFRRAFVVRFCDQLNTAYSRAHATNQWARWLAIVDPEMGEHVNRWRQPADWNAERSRIRSYAEQRTEAVWGHVQRYFGMGARYDLTVAVTNAEEGFARVNTIDLDEGTAGFYGYPWTGSYFPDYPVALSAVARPGYRFVEWRQGGGGVMDTNATVELTLSGSTEVAAVFERLAFTNLPPVVVAPIGFQALVQGAGALTVDLAGAFSDPESNALAFAATSGDTNAVSVGVNGALLSIVALRSGEALVTATADDGANPPATNSFRVMVYPAAHVLKDGPYAFGAWASNQPAGRYPEHMVFLQSDQSDTAIDTPLEYAYRIPEADASVPQDATFPYAATARTRINGLGDDGMAFINTGRGRDLGGALLALDTRNVVNAPVAWVGGTVNSASRIYAIRLQYRIGTTGTFLDVPDGSGQPVEYLRNVASGHSQGLGPVLLPAEAMGQEYVQVLWRYYRVSGESGARAQLRLDDVSVANAYSLPAIALAFAAEPPAVALSGSPMSAFSVRAVDAEGQVDTNYEGVVAMKLASGTGALGGGTNALAVAGVATFESAILSGAGEHSLRATSGLLSPAVSRVILVDAEPIFLPGGNGSWTQDGNWSSLAYPNAVGATAKIRAPAGANRAVTLGGPVAVGSLTVDNAASAYRNRIDGAFPLAFEASAGAARLRIDGEGTGFVEFNVAGGVELSSDLEIDVSHLEGDPDYGALRLREFWGGPGGIEKTGAGMVSLTGSGKSFQGGIVVEQGVLAITQPSSPTNSSGTSVWPGGQVRLTSANDEFGARIYTFGGTLALDGTGRSGVPESENLGVLGALRYDPGTPGNRAVISGPVQIGGESDIHVATASNVLELAGTLAGSHGFAKTGAGLLVVGGAGSSYSGAIEVRTGSLRVDAELGAAPAILSAGTLLEGAGRVQALEGSGTVSPGPGSTVLTAASVDGLNYRLSFSKTGAPLFGQPAASGNDLLRLEGAIPFAGALDGSSAIEVYLDVAALAAGDAFEGGFFTDESADFLSFVEAAAWRFFVRAESGATEHEGVAYAETAGGTNVLVFTAACEADFGAGTVTGRILRIQFGEVPAPEGFAAWRQGEFTEGELADPETSGPLADPDGSGIPHLLRYALGLGRRDDYAAALPCGAINDAPAAVFRHRRLTAETGGVEYVVEVCDEVVAGEWRAAVEGVDLAYVGATPTGDGATETAEYLILGVAPGDPRCFRLRVRMVE